MGKVFASLLNGYPVVVKRFHTLSDPELYGMSAEEYAYQRGLLEHEVCSSGCIKAGRKLVLADQRIPPPPPPHPLPAQVVVLSTLHHPNILQLLGVLEVPGPPECVDAMVTELANGGSLNKYLEGRVRAVSADRHQPSHGRPIAFLPVPVTMLAVVFASACNWDTPGPGSWGVLVWSGRSSSA